MKQRHSNDKELEEFLTVGIIQTNIDYEMAWEWPELSKKGFCNLNNGYYSPQIIVLPELTVPHGYVEDLKILSKAVGAVVIAGVDFEEVADRKVRNKAVIMIPENWPNIGISDIRKSKRASSVFWGKTFFRMKRKFSSVHSRLLTKNSLIRLIIFWMQGNLEKLVWLFVLIFLTLKDLSYIAEESVI